MTSIAEQRRAVVDAAVSRIRTIEASMGVNPGSLELIKQEMQALAAQEHLFPLSDFPLETRPGEYHQLSRDADDRFTVNIVTSTMRRYVPPHNHTTWAVVVAVEGTELNTIYRRVDDASVPGHAQLEVVGEQAVTPGSGIALMPDAIHSIELTGQGVSRLIHIYGISLERCGERMLFDIGANKATPFSQLKKKA